MRYERGMARSLIAHITMCVAESWMRVTSRMHGNVQTLRLQSNKVPEVVVRTLALGDLIVWFRFDGVDDVGELDSILDEEDRDYNCKM